MIPILIWAQYAQTAWVAVKVINLLRAKASQTDHVT